ncbi:TonB-dependent receptor [Simiduia agarivorans]|uniref:TonB-dependent transporter Oar-like beta-barrel domain-containing protein n=1 Tax=Simiduia agarivorans (strain DSM 21679 / JCM 13881 / BCRC 17597 / SA1) TaxID=1117647 RepID=K4KHY3_SIMAS|nr:carboxypeptidase regulatory-like domain-containing protein [Simiduia agarivorans]AFU98714.1 hypothetical protein M5M_07615 [Simiduia agarivorans SA1 = DSM 21679]
MSSHPRGFELKRLVTATRNAISKPAAYSAAVMVGALLALPAQAQLAGGIKGKVSAEAGAQVEGVKVTATSNVMPKARTVTTSGDGSYNLPLLVPGKYLLTFEAADGSVRTVNTEVLLEQTTRVDMVIDSQLDAAEMEEVYVMGQAINLAGNASVANAIGADVVEGVPVGQDYRDLMKLIPGVQYSENSVLGPSAGGSGVDNSYGFDGVDVSLPLFGNLASEPSTHDVEMVSIKRGGAAAIGFNRAGGFAMNTKSKSGTNEFHGNLEYKIQPKSFVSDIKNGATYELDQSWFTGAVSGPIVQDKLFFYGSYYRPEVTRENKETAYGPAKDYRSVRDEYFGKLTYAPIDYVLLNLSYRTSDRLGEGLSVGQFERDDVSLGEKADQDILTFDGSWIITPDTTLSFAYNSFALETASLPDNLLAVVPSTGASLDLANLDQMGYFTVPTLLDNATTPEELAYNAQAQVLINQYGYDGTNGKTGGGAVGGYSSINNQNFFRDSFEIALDHELSFGSTTHELHVGFKYSSAKEELSRFSNGWGSVEYIGGLEAGSDAGATPVFYQTLTQQQSLVDDSGEVVPVINSYIENYNLELNDTITHGNFTYNIGVLISKDELYGQGLREKAGTVSGFELATGNKYKMYTVDWKDMIQPRLGVTWAYNGQDTVFANYATYNPEATSLPRAASWDRNLARELWVEFDENGDYIASRPKRASSGKFFQEGMKPRTIEEFTFGTTKGVTDQLSVRAHVRYREGSHFWEDIWNYARSSEGNPYNANTDRGVPAHIEARGDYVPNLADVRAEIGGSSYVIAEMDDGYTKYWEVNLEAEWVGERTYLSASYTRSRYWGNFDADNSTGVNDANNFVGSSYIADDTGKYIWDHKEGTLSGDRPHIFKAYGYYTTDWKANIGAYLVFQSGQPWEKWSGAYYGLPDNSYYYTTNAYAEDAGSRRSPSHWQLDLNYTQNFAVYEGVTLKFRADLFNVFDRQTGYNYDPYDYSETFGQARSYFSPRRLQLSFGVDF